MSVVFNWLKIGFICILVSVLFGIFNDAVTHNTQARIVGRLRDLKQKDCVQKWLSYCVGICHEVVREKKKTIRSVTYRDTNRSLLEYKCKASSLLSASLLLDSLMTSKATSNSINNKRPSDQLREA